MKKELFAAAFCGVLLLMLGFLWWRVRELEKTADTKQVFKLIDASEAVDPGKSKVGVPWSVERAMMGGADHSMGPTSGGATRGEFKITPAPVLLPDQHDSK